MKEQSAKVQEVHKKNITDVMIELDELNDSIPLNTYYKYGGIEIKCLKSYINNIIINYCSDSSWYEYQEYLINIYEDITGTRISPIKKNTVKMYNIIHLLNILIKDIPPNIPVYFLGEHIDCFRSVIAITKEGLQYYPNSKYWESCTREIYKTLDNHGHLQFNGKY